ncbi:hypothetical protein Leryth_027308 [Lithospermum erythrorhizon]|nr:hypothetical protein Leryth_027308 [Lithospermum erythrorhizon]
MDDDIDVDTNLAFEDDEFDDYNIYRGLSTQSAEVDVRSEKDIDLETTQACSRTSKNVLLDG